MAKFSKPAGTLFTQISSGIYKGKKLALPALSSTRSTKSIVKGSFFDTWRAQLRGASFIECFGGSGAMALEALSNGAKNVYAIEKDAAAHRVMRKNFELFELGANAILGDCFERLPEILHDLQANINGRSGANSLNLSGKNFKNRVNEDACCENLDDEKEGCRKSFSGVEQGEDRCCAAQSSGAEGEHCGVSDDTGGRGAPDFGLSGGENFNDMPEKQSAADKILSGLSGDRGAVSCARRGGADAGFCVDRSLGADASGTGLNTYFDGAQCGTSINLNLKNDMRSSAQDSAQNGVQRSVNDDCTGVEDFGGCTQISDYASASSIKYCANSLATDAASFSEKFDDNYASKYDASGTETANRDVNLSSTCGESSAANLNKSHTVNSSENSVSDPARRVFVYLDPPFAIRQGFAGVYERVLALIARLGSVQCELLIAIEHMSELELPSKIGDFALLKSRKFGATTMSYYAK